MHSVPYNFIKQLTWIIRNRAKGANSSLFLLWEKKEYCIYVFNFTCAFADDPHWTIMLRSEISLKSIESEIIFINVLGEIWKRTACLTSQFWLNMGLPGIHKFLFCASIRIVIFCVCLSINYLSIYYMWFSRVETCQKWLNNLKML